MDAAQRGHDACGIVPSLRVRTCGIAPTIRAKPSEGSLTRRIELTRSRCVRDLAERVWEAPSVHTACVTSCMPHPPIHLRTTLIFEGLQSLKNRALVPHVPHPTGAG